MKKPISFFVLLFSFLFVFNFAASAQTIDTIIKGTVRDSEGNTMGNIPTEVTCNGNIKNTTANGFGDYLVTYPANQCSEGDTVFVVADTPYGEGYASGIVERFTSGFGLNLDISLVNIAVPEFGVITGVVAALGSGATYLAMKRKFV